MSRKGIVYPRKAKSRESSDLAKMTPEKVCAIWNGLSGFDFLGGFLFWFGSFFVGLFWLVFGLFWFSFGVFWGFFLLCFACRMRVFNV